MSEAPQREWRFYLKDMLGFADKVLRIRTEWINKHSSHLEETAYLLRNPANAQRLMASVEQLKQHRMR